ncbi:MAG: hypothetical protein F6K37_40605, partial [Moorea sp. SIO4E2]|nr:hypothetical protein [Moorena sp. SIO4E2]
IVETTQKLSEKLFNGWVRVEKLLVTHFSNPLDGLWSKVGSTTPQDKFLDSF